MSICIGTFEIRVCFAWSWPEWGLLVGDDDEVLAIVFLCGPLLFTRYLLEAE